MESGPKSGVILITPPNDDESDLKNGKKYVDGDLGNKENETGKKDGIKLRPKKGKREKDSTKRVSFADMSDEGDLVHIHEIEEDKSPDEEDVVWLACENTDDMGLLDQKCREFTLSDKGKECKPELSICFEDPSSNVEFLDKFKDKVISLARCRVRHRYVLGIALVKKVNDKSSVFARHSYDGWKTHEDTHATIIENHSNVDITHFSFILDFPKDSQELEFAICHKLGDDEHWDSNDGINYKIKDLNHVLNLDDD